MDAGDAPEFSLRAELRGHGEDVRCVAVAGPLGVATASRDRTVRLWPFPAAADGDAAAAAPFGEPTVFVGHGHYVTALAWAPPGALAGVAAGSAGSKGALVSGSRDAHVFVWDVDTAAPLLRLAGHAQQVAALAVTAAGEIVSGDLGGEIRVWRGGACVQTLSGGAPVLSLAALPDGGFVVGTGGPLFAIKLFTRDASGAFAAGETLRGHGDSVRGLSLAPASLAGGAGGLLSASHDGSARLWAASGAPLAEFVGHTALVYCAAAAADGGLVATGSEDDTARLWGPDGSPLQALRHPGCVWALTWLPDGDLVTACADGVARVWTRDAARASAELSAAHAAALASRASAAAAPAPGAAPPTDAALAAALPAGLRLEDPSVLSRPGAKDGTTKVVREGDSAVAYSWDASAARWERIGEVVGAGGAAGGGGASGGEMGVGGRTHEGVSYDWVFDVDVADGAPPRKLPYNAGDNPYDVADKWLAREGLPQSYREQIVAFIIQNTGGAASAALGPIGVNADPFTGGGSYTPSAAPLPFSAPAASAAPPRRALAFCPMRTHVFFDSTAAGLEACARKLREFSAGAPADVALGADDDVALTGLVAALAPGAAAAPLPAGAGPLFGKLLTWQEAHLFAVLDLARGAMLRADAAAALLAAGSDAAAAPGSALLAALLRAAPAAVVGGAGATTALRCFANAYATSAGAAWAAAAGLTLLDAFASAPSAPARPARAAFTTALLNVAVAAAAAGGAPEAAATRAAALNAAVAAAVSVPAEDDDAVARALVAIGTLAAADAAAAKAAAELGAGDVAAAALQRGGPPGAKAPVAAQDVADILAGAR